MERVFIRAVGGHDVGEIADRDWDAERASLKLHHGIVDPLDSYSMPVADAAKKYARGEINEHAATTEHEDVATVPPREQRESRRPR